MRVLNLAEAVLSVMKVDSKGGRLTGSSVHKHTNLLRPSTIITLLSNCRLSSH